MFTLQSIWNIHPWNQLEKKMKHSVRYHYRILSIQLRKHKPEIKKSHLFKLFSSKKNTKKKWTKWEKTSSQKASVSCVGNQVFLQPWWQQHYANKINSTNLNTTSMIILTSNWWSTCLKHLCTPKLFEYNLI